MQPENTPKSIHPSLEIHHISISAGDATVLVVREDLEKHDPAMLILIDAGKSALDLQTIESYCADQFTNYAFDKVIVSHMHKDHFGDLPYAALFDDSETELVIGRYLDGSYPFRKLAASLTEYGSAQQRKKTGSDSNAPAAKNRLIKVPQRAEDLPYTINLPNGGTLTCYCNGGVIPGDAVVEENKPAVAEDDEDEDMSETANALATPPTASEKKKIDKTSTDDNDLSLAWLLEYNGFRYFTSGDLSGATEIGYIDIETKLIGYLYGDTGPLGKAKNNGVEQTVQVLKATHHGSKYSSLGSEPVDEDEDVMTENADVVTEGDGGAAQEPLGSGSSNSYFLNKLKPELIVVPCNNSLKSPLPTSEFFSRAENAGVKRMVLVNQFERSPENTTKNLTLSSEHWKTKLNQYPPGAREDKITPVFQEFFPAYVVDEAKTPFSNAYLHADKTYLPVCKILVNQAGKYTVTTTYCIDFQGKKSGRGRKVRQETGAIPQQIPAFYFEKRTTEFGLKSPFEEVLRAADMDELTEYLDQIAGLYGKEGDVYELKKGDLDEEALARYEGFALRYDFANFIQRREVKVTRESKSSASANQDYLQKRLSDYIQKICDWNALPTPKNPFGYVEYTGGLVEKERPYYGTGKKNASGKIMETSRVATDRDRRRSELSRKRKRTEQEDAELAALQEDDGIAVRQKKKGTSKKSQNPSSNGNQL